MDVNNDGVLNIRELKDYIRRYPCRNVPDHLAKNILNISDTNSDGVLDFEEFYQMSRKYDLLLKRMVHKYCQLVVPHPHRTQRVEIGKFDHFYVSQNVKLTNKPFPNFLTKQIVKRCVRPFLRLYLSSQ